jgi:DNA-binding transcriptional ArsR family regulator
VDTLVNVLKALSDETRLRIISLLYEKELCVCDIMVALHISQTKASRHLNCLRNAGMVKDRKQAQWVYYSLISNEDLKFMDSLVFGNLRTHAGFNDDLQNLTEWLAKKDLEC